MGMRPLRASLALASLIAIAFIGVGAEAAPRRDEACVSAADRVQSLRDDGQLRAALREALSCESESCPAVIRHDCEQWADQIERNLPTIVIRASDARSPQDVTHVNVSLDGRTIVEELDGKAVAVDPGKHRLSLRAPGFELVEMELLVVQGEKNRPLIFSLTPTSSSSSSFLPSSSSSSRHSEIPTTTWIAGGVAAVALSSMLVFGFSALAKKNNLESTCAPMHACTSDDRDALHRNGLIADVSFSISVIATAVAVTTFIRRPSR